MAELTPEMLGDYDRRADQIIADARQLIRLGVPIGDLTDAELDIAIDFLRVISKELAERENADGLRRFRAGLSNVLQAEKLVRAAGVEKEVLDLHRLMLL